MIDGQTEFDFIRYALETRAARLFDAATAVLLLLGMLRLWNHLGGNKFDAWLTKANEKGGLAAGLYYGFRVAAIAGIVAAYLR
jgi:hypothetical protein